MKVYEILSLNRELFERLHDFGITSEDYRWVPLYHEFLKMRKGGRENRHGNAAESTLEP